MWIVDDILITSNDLPVVNRFKTYLCDQFKLMDLGPWSNWVLQIKEHH